MLNPFSISLADQPLKIYSGLCLNEGSSLTHRAPLILGEKTNSCPADTRLTVPFPSPGDAQPFLAVIPHHLCSATNTSGPPWLWGCPSAKHPVLRYPLLPVGHGDAPLGGGGPACHAPLPAPGWGRQQDRAVLQIPLCWCCSFPSPNYGVAAGTSLARLDPGVRPGSEGQPCSRDSADVF